MRHIYTLLLLLCTSLLYSQDTTEVNLNDYIQSINKTEEKGDTMKMVLWFPTEFWHIANKNTPNYDSNAVSLLENLTEDYMIFAVVDGYFSVDKGGFKTEAELRKSISLIDKNNKVHLPLSDLKVPKALQHLISSMKPMLTSNLGEVGKGYNFYYFQVKDSANNNLISAKQKGEFTIMVSNSSFKWNLPLSAYLPSKYCPVDMIKMNSDWNYCPFHGTKLTNKQ